MENRTNCSVRSSTFPSSKCYLLFSTIYCRLIYFMAVKRLITRKKRVSIRRLVRFQFFSRTTKREKLIFSSLTITTIVLLSAFTRSQPLWLVLFALAGASVVTLVIFSLQDDLRGVRYVFIPLLPLLFTLAIML